MTTNTEKLGYNEPYQYDMEELIAFQKEQLERQKNARVVNKFTGEVRRFRSTLNAGNYDDGTIIVEPSDTDTSDYEPLETTIERCSRSGYLQEYVRRMQLADSEVLVDNDPNNFDFEPDIIETSGFDLADAKEKETEILNQLNKTPVSEVSKGAATSEPASANASPSEPNAPAE